MPAKMSLKMLAPRMASPLTRPRYWRIGWPSTVGVVTMSIGGPPLDVEKRGATSSRPHLELGAASRGDPDPPLLYVPAAAAGAGRPAELTHQHHPTDAGDGALGSP